jgi:hypothetical protein
MRKGSSTPPGWLAKQVKPSFLELLRAIDRARVECVVVGGVAALLEGAPIVTVDLDIVCRPDIENRRRLLSLLEGLDATYREPAGRRIRPTLARLASQRTSLLETRLGPLDVFQRIGPDWSWDEVADRSHRVQVGDLEIRVLRLAAIIESKSGTGRDKDRAMLPVLRRTLEEK